MRKSTERREQILELVSTAALRTQEELAERLAERGFGASQSSISRDVAALGLIKVNGSYALPPSTVEGVVEPMEERIRRHLLSLVAAGDHLLVLKVPAGEAPPVAIAIDTQAFPGVVGTLAGDDTIFVAVRNAAAARTVSERLRSLMRVRPAAGA